MRAKNEITSAEIAISKISTGATVAIGGFVGAGHPELLTATLEKYFLEQQSPRDLTLIYAAGQGDAKDRGLNHLAHEGLIKRVIGGHWNLAPKLGKLALDNKIEAYNFPQGVVCELFREIAAKRPGVFTKVGMESFIDPKQFGGRMNECTTEELIERVTLDGEEWLWYKSVPIQVALIRATCADKKGNLTMEREALVGDGLPIAQAAKNHGGIVIAQVEKLCDEISNPKDVRVPGILVDYIVVSDTHHHEQTFAESYNENYVRRCEGSFNVPVMEFSERKIIGRRAAREIQPDEIVNLGIGLPESVASVASEEGKLDEFTLTVEAGPIGGVPAGGLSFGCSTCPEAIIDQPSMFDYYDGGGLDIAVLGAVEIDAQGSVNVSSFAGRFAGVGGFLNISSNAKRIVFCCTFTAGGLKVDAQDGQLQILQEGKHGKFVKDLSQVCFHGPSALQRGQKVLFVTERAVFELTKRGLKLRELAAGIDLQTQVLDLMQFSPVVGNYRVMDTANFWQIN
ncbi:MAG: malonate decarboxylase subunit alpha [Abditibacteriaceae bacterium]